MANNRIESVGINIAEKATVIWNIADILRGPYKPHEYGTVILPFTVIKRLHDCLLPTHDKVVAEYEKIKHLAKVDTFLTRASGYQFYNTSKFTFATLLSDPDNIETNFRDFLGGFSANVQDVLSKFDMDGVIKRLVEANCLYLVIREFNSDKGYLGPDKVAAVDCGYIFEDLVRRFSESFGEEAGAHFTSRDIIYLMTDILLAFADLSDLSQVSVYDMTMGTSQMLSCMEERIRDLNGDCDVICFGQEINPSTYAIAKADMLIRGGNPDNMRFGDTLSDDKFPSFHFDYIISNPPFGIDWKKEQKAVEDEHKMGEAGRFAPGLPKISDGQQLFVLNGISKLTGNGRMAIIQNGSPLFSGDADSGPSRIRQYILEKDWLDAIIQLPNDAFMNTGIATRPTASSPGGSPSAPSAMTSPTAVAISSSRRIAIIATGLTPTTETKPFIARPGSLTPWSSATTRSPWRALSGTKTGISSRTRRVSPSLTPTSGTRRTCRSPKISTPTSSVRSCHTTLMLGSTARRPRSGMRFR